MTIFEDDIRDAENSLKKEKKKGFISRLLTLGLINNSEKIKSMDKESVPDIFKSIPGLKLIIYYFRNFSSKFYIFICIYRQIEV